MSASGQVACHLRSDVATCPEGATWQKQKDEDRRDEGGEGIAAMKRLSTIRAAVALIVASVLCPAAVHAGAAEVEDISDRYFDAVHAELKGATQSVWVAMYEIRVYEGNKANKAYVLLQNLVDAHERGVDVQVFLDRSYR